MGVVDDIKRQFSPMGKMTNQIVIVIVAAFLLVNIPIEIARLYKYDLYTPINNWLALPASLKQLITRPWTIFTYGALHSGIFHILFNMLWLYWFGQLIEEYLGKRKILPLFLLSVFLGGLVFIIAYNLFPQLAESKDSAILVGASAGVMGVAWAAVTLLPEHRFNLIFLGPIKIIYIALFMTIMDLLSLAGSNAGGNFAHLGGALMGFLFIKQMQAGRDFSNPINQFFDWVANLFQPRKKLKVSYRKQTTKTRRKETKPRSTKRDYLSKKEKATVSSSSNDANRQKRIDKILDKISQGGYDSLTKDEKAFLFKVSNEKDA